MTSRKDEARGQAGSGKAIQQQTSTKPTGGRPEVQGNRTARNACQNAPTWDRPAGAAAADELLRAIEQWVRR